MNWILRYRRERTRILIEIDADEVTINEIVTKFNPLVQGVLKPLVKKGKQRADGKTVKKPCGCGE